MAEESLQSKTEPATPHKLEKAREKGQIAYSTDLTSGASLLLCSMFLAIFGETLLSSLQASTDVHFTYLQHITSPDLSWEQLCLQTSMAFALAIVPFTVVAFATTLLSGAMLTGFHPSPKAFRVDFSKLDPKNGIKRIFSSRSLVRGCFSIAKLAALVTIVVWILAQSTDELQQLASLHILAIIGVGWGVVVRICLGLSAALLAMGLIDLLYQRWKHLQDMRMTQQEMRDERRETDVDPLIRARIKKVQREFAQRRMMQDVPSSSVVVTNPTHFAVAIKYDRETMPAPVIVAKGADHMAQKIISIAREHSVAIVERKPLARWLYQHTEIGQEIPQEVYQTVAEVLAFVYQSGRAA